jgi:hypothetical protein
MKKTAVLGLLGHLMAAGLSNDRMSAGQRRASDAERMRTSQAQPKIRLHLHSAGKPKKKPFGAPKLSRRQRKLLRAK